MENPILLIGHTQETMDVSKSHTLAKVSIYSIIMRNTSIIHIINYSSLQVITLRYYGIDHTLQIEPSISKIRVLEDYLFHY